MGKTIKLLQIIWGLIALYASAYLAVEFVDKLQLAPPNALWGELVKLTQLLGPTRLFSNDAAISVLLILVSASLVVLAQRIREVELW